MEQSENPQSPENKLRIKMINWELKEVRRSYRKLRFQFSTFNYQLKRKEMCGIKSKALI